MYDQGSGVVKRSKQAGTVLLVHDIDKNLANVCCCGLTPYLRVESLAAGGAFTSGT